MKVYATLLWLLLLAVVTDWTMMKSEATESVLPESGVSRELARARAATISDLRYLFRFEIAPGGGTIKGYAEIRFRWQRSSAPIVLDFRDLDQSGQTSEGKVSQVTINQRPVKDFQQHNGHLVLPSKYFQAGENLLALNFETASAPAGRPIIRYVDPDDGSEYLYTLFVPMDASLAFPCFDQPDLKARFRLSILAPEEWRVITNVGLLGNEVVVRGPLPPQAIEVIRHAFRQADPQGQWRGET